MSDTAERLLKAKTRIAEAMTGDNCMPETLDAGEQAIAQELTNILRKVDEISNTVAGLVRRIGQ